MSTAATQPIVRDEVSTVRLSLMRLVFLLNFVFLTLDVVPQMIHLAGRWDPLRGVAFSCWLTLALLGALGIRYPLKMVPILLFQCVYKTIWLLAIYLPGTATATGLLPIMLGGVVVDVAVIPWSYVVSTFVRAPGDRWK
jgi:hypothetical protein